MNSLVLHEDGSERYQLSDNKKDELLLIVEISQKREQHVINKIFKDAPDGIAKYEEPFWFALSYIFSNVGEYSAKIISGTTDKETVLFPLLNNCLGKIKERFEINFKYFEKRLLHFFSELNEPIYNETKCILTQNHFIAKTIGINPDSAIFSEELFKDKVFYLDTNVILAIVSQHNRKHNNAISFIKAAKNLGLKFCIAHITTIEYEKWIDGEFERIRKTINQIPLRTQSKIGSPVYQDYFERYSELAAENDDIDTEDVLSEIETKYQNYKEILSDLIPSESLEYIDDLWFDSIREDKDFEFFVKHVKEKYSEVSNIREKGDKAAVHDAKILLWLENISEEYPDKYLFVSTDTSLPLIKFSSTKKSKSINLEALLQWIIPITNSHTEKDIDHVVAEILKQKILPQEFMFEIKDFIIFDQLQMECKELPHEDVENCIQHLKNNVSELNPNSAEDREKFASEIAKYFVDPSRKYKKELSERERENEELQTKLGDVYEVIENLKENTEKKDNELEQTRIHHTEEITKIKDEHSENLEEVLGNLQGVSDEFEQAQENHAKEITKIKDKHSEKLGEVLGALQGVSDEFGKIKEENRQEKIKEKLKNWKNPAKYALVLLILLILFGIFEFIPDWGWNYPAKLLLFFDSLEENSKATFNICVGLNIFLLSGLIISLFIFIYYRLINKDNIESKKEQLNEMIK